MQPSSFTSCEDLLSQMGWPAGALEQKGTLRWASALGEPPDKVMAAIVLCKKDQVILRVQSSALDSVDLNNLLEASWAIGPDKLPEFQKVSVSGTVFNMSESSTLDYFKGIVKTLGERPTFQTMGTRWREQPAPSASLRA